MQTRLYSLAFLVAAAVLWLPADAAFAQKQKRDAEPRSIRGKCIKEAGGHYIPQTRTWQIHNYASSAQMQQFYNCLDSYTMKSR